MTTRGCRKLLEVAPGADRLEQALEAFLREHQIEYLRTCIACGTVKRSRDAAHVGPHGIGQKASDLDTIPACRACHQDLHRLGPVRFQLLHNLDFSEAIATLQNFYTIKYGRLPENDQKRAA